jgi:hypothetical protein
MRRKVWSENPAGVGVVLVEGDRGLDAGSERSGAIPTVPHRRVLHGSERKKQNLCTDMARGVSAGSR